MKRALCCAIVAVCTWGISAEEPGPAAAKESAPPAPVSKEMLKFLQTNITLKVNEMAPSAALSWQLRLSDIPLTIETTKKVDAQKVSFELIDVPLAGALRTISEKTGSQYRFVPGGIRMAMADEWKQIDAGKVRFEELAAKAPGK